MSYDNKALFEFINAFSFDLNRKKLPEKYHLKYIKLYFKLNGTKGYINYDDIACLWDLNNKEQASYYINKFKEYELLDKTQQTDLSANNNKGYLFIIPLLHPNHIK